MQSPKATPVVSDESSGELTPVERSQKLAASLSSFARSLTFENRSRRNLYRLAGLTPRTRDRVFAFLIAFSFVAVFLIPFIACVAYFTFLVTPQYTSEVRFVLRSSVPLLTRDRYSASSVGLEAKIVQDTAIVLNYFESPAIISALKDEIDIDYYFRREEIDYFSRLESEYSDDDLLDYWLDQHFSWVNPKSGIVELEVRAFSREDAYALLTIVMKLAEDQVNQLNRGMWEDLRRSASADAEKAQQDLANLRIRMRDIQNRTGVYDIELLAESKLQVLTELETNLAGLRSERAALETAVSENSARVADINRQIAAHETQVERLRSEFAGNANQDVDNLANYSVMFDELNLELELAESRLQSAIKEQEKVNLVSSLQLVFLDAFTEPTQPDESDYPKVISSILWSFVLCLLAWGSAAGGIVLIRNKVD